MRNKIPDHFYAYLREYSRQLYEHLRCGREGEALSSWRDLWELREDYEKELLDREKENALELPKLA